MKCLLFCIFISWSVHCLHCTHKPELLNKTLTHSQGDQSSCEFKDVGGAESQNKSRSLLSRTLWMAHWTLCLLSSSFAVLFSLLSKVFQTPKSASDKVSVSLEMYSHKLYLQYLILRCFIEF